MGKCVVVMPAYNAERTLPGTFSLIPMEYVDEVILVDDGSNDATVEIAQKLGVRLIEHPKNAGYGANQKTCYREALKRSADVVVMLHPDGQHDPKLIPMMIEEIESGAADMVFASRFIEKGGALRGGMPLYKFIANRFLTAYENLLFRTAISEFHTGYRAYSRRLLETIPFPKNSDGFIFDQQVIFQCMHFGFKISEIPAVTVYSDETSSIKFNQSIIYGLKTISLSMRYLLHKHSIVKYGLFVK